MQIFTSLCSEIEGRIDPHYYLPTFKQLIASIRKLPNQTLDEVVEFSKQTWDKKSMYKEKFPYIEISQIDTNTGEIKNCEEINISEAPSRARMIVKANDIIVSTTRPHRGAISYLDDKYDNYIASTGFAILRQLKNGSMSKDYLFFILRSNLILQQMLQRSSGGNYPAITSEELKKIIIPVPNKDAQAKIVHIMQSVYEQKQQKEKEARELLDSIDGYVLNELGLRMPEIKNEMTFIVNSDEVEGKRIDPYFYQPKFIALESALARGKYTTKPLSTLAARVLSGQRPKGGVNNYSSGIPSLGGEHVLENGDIERENLKFIPQNFHKSHLSSSIMPNDILLVKDGATTGKVGIFPEDYPYKEVNINEHVFLIRLNNDVDPYYIFAFLNSEAGQIQLKKEVSGGTIMGIIRESLNNILIPIPEYDTQKKLVQEIKNRLEKAKNLRKEGIQNLEKVKKQVEEMILSGN